MPDGWEEGPKCWLQSEVVEDFFPGIRTIRSNKKGDKRFGEEEESHIHKKHGWFFYCEKHVSRRLVYCCAVLIRTYPQQQEHSLFADSKTWLPWFLMVPYLNLRLDHFGPCRQPLTQWSCIIVCRQTAPLYKVILVGDSKYFICWYVLHLNLSLFDILFWMLIPSA